MIPFSFIQKGLMFDVLNIGNNVPIYNNGGMVDMRGFVDTDLLEKAVRLSIKRCNIISACIIDKDCEYFFEYGRFETPAIDFVDFSEELNPEKEAHSYCSKSVAESFGNLINMPLYRFSILKLSENHYALHMKYHQIINDGWGIVRHLTDIAECYTALLNGDEDKLPPMNDYEIFQSAQAEYINSDKFKKDLQFMTSYYEDTSEKLFPLAKLGSRESFRSIESDYVLTLPFLNSLKNTASASGVSLTNILYIATYLAVFKFFGVKNQTYSYINLNRRGHVQKNTVGSFVNVLAMKAGFGTDCTMKELGVRFARESMSLMRHTACPSVFVSSELTKNGQKGQHVGEISVNHITPKLPQKIGGVDLKIIYTPSGFSGYPLDIIVQETTENKDVLLRTVKKRNIMSENDSLLFDRYLWNLLNLFTVEPNMACSEALDKCENDNVPSPFKNPYNQPDFSGFEEEEPENGISSLSEGPKNRTEMTETEAKLKSIWEKLTNLKIDDPYTNFFAVGGHSLLVIQMVKEIKNATGVILKAKDIFEMQTLEKISKIVDISINARRNIAIEHIMNDFAAALDIDIEKIAKDTAFSEYCDNTTQLDNLYKIINDKYHLSINEQATSDILTPEKIYRMVRFETENEDEDSTEALSLEEIEQLNKLLEN
ncbi:MAG: hypothetical protein C0602_06370 [Denitrovibrio sp.]|nr:MAG: hypothetical protein C0602_06370 [Denitrovibrio sp.]